jgi:hypothetical protein
MNFSSNITDFISTVNADLYTGIIKGNYPNHWGGGSSRSLNYL